MHKEANAQKAVANNPGSSSPLPSSHHRIQRVLHVVSHAAQSVLRGSANQQSRWIDRGCRRALRVCRAAFSAPDDPLGTVITEPPPMGCAGGVTRQAVRLIAQHDLYISLKDRVNTDREMHYLARRGRTARGRFPRNTTHDRRIRTCCPRSRRGRPSWRPHHARGHTPARRLPRA